jgi:hypothetical protein
MKDSLPLVGKKRKALFSYLLTVLQHIGKCDEDQEPEAKLAKG